jgi:hypothetical protein
MPATDATPVNLWALARVAFSPTNPLYFKALRHENERRQRRHLLLCPRLARVN